MNVYEGSLVATGLKAALVVARFNSLITEQLLQGAADALRRHGVKDGDLDVFRCPGTFELPALLRRVVRTGRYDAVVALGAVIRGGTPHFEYIAAEVTKGIAQVALSASIPVVYGVITTDTIEQAIERAGTKAGNKGFDAALSAIEMVSLAQALSNAGY